MNRKWKIAAVAAAVLLLAGTTAFAQAGSSPKAAEQALKLDESAWCGPRGGSGFGPGGCFGPGGYNGGPDEGGAYGGGFSCH